MKKFVWLLVLSLVVMGSITFSMVYLFMEESPEIVLDERMWSEELLQMKQEKLAEYEAREVDVLPSRQGTVYVIDGVPSMHRPEWLTETGDVVLPEAARESIALEEVIETPGWWFWPAQATVDEIREVKDGVPFVVLLVGGFFGVICGVGTTRPIFPPCKDEMLGVTVLAVFVGFFAGLLISFVTGVLSLPVAILTGALTVLLIPSMTAVIRAFLVVLSLRLATH